MDPQHRFYVPLKFLFDNITRHLTISCILAFTVATVWFLTWPLQSKNAYFSENALAVGHHSPKYEFDDVNVALRISKELQQAFSGGKQQALNYLEKTLYSYGLETKQHEYHVTRNFINDTVSIHGKNLYASIRAPRGSGKESIVLTAPLDPKKCDNMGLAVSLMKVMSSFKWLHHDFILVVTDDGGHPKLDGGILAFIDQQVISTGRMREAITLDFETFSFPQMAVLTEGVNGEVPNLDLVNTVIWLARHHDISVTLFEDSPLTVDPKRLKNLPLPIYLYHKLLSSLSKTIDDLIKQHRLSLPFDEYTIREVKDKFVSGSQILMYNVYNQLLGIPTGGHAWFRQRVTHAITLTNAKGHFPTIQPRHASANIKNVAKTVEGAFRSMNNLIEELHQSFFLYFMDSSVTYFGFEHYLPNLIVLGAPLVIQFVGNYFISARLRVIHSVLIVAATVVSCVSIYVSPYWIVRLGVDTPTFVISWAGFVVTVILLLFAVVFPSIDHFYDEKNSVTEWRTLKASAVGYACFTMGVLLVFNAALYIAVVSYLFYMCLCINNVRNDRSVIVKLGQFLLLLLFSPFSVLAGVFIGRSIWLDDNILDQIQRLLQGGVIDVYTNALYVTATLVVLPVWLVFIKLSLDGLRNRILHQDEIIAGVPRTAAHQKTE